MVRGQHHRRRSLACGKKRLFIVCDKRKGVCIDDTAARTRLVASKKRQQELPRRRTAVQTGPRHKGSGRGKRSSRCLGRRCA